MEGLSQDGRSQPECMCLVETWEAANGPTYTQVGLLHTVEFETMGRGAYAVGGSTGTALVHGGTWACTVRGVQLKFETPRSRPVAVRAAGPNVALYSLPLARHSS